MILGALLVLLPASALWSSPGAPPHYVPPFEFGYADRYVDIGLRNFESGQYLAAVEALETALVYRPSHADAAYLRALCAEKLEEGIPSRLAWLERALSGDDFRLFEREEAVWGYVQLLMRTGQRQNALAFLDQLPLSPESLLARIELYRLSGQSRNLQQHIMLLLDRYPERSAGLIPWLESLNSDQRQPDTEPIIRRLLALLPFLSQDNPALVPALLPFHASLEEQRLLLAEHRRREPPSFSSTRLALQLGLISDSQAVDELFSGAYALHGDYLHQLFPLLATEDGRSLFALQWRTFNGLAILDSNADTLPEQVVEYTNGMPVRASLDNNQDGVPELELRYVQGLAAEAKARLGSTQILLRYKSWPYCDQVTFEDARSRRTYWLPLTALAAPIAVQSPIGKISGKQLYSLELDTTLVPLERACQNLAIQYEEESAVRTTQAVLHDGRLQSTRYEQGNGGFGETKHDVDGLTTLERLDFDGDGRWNAIRHWQRQADGVSLAVAIDLDSDDDGFLDYREMLVPPLTRYWDIDNDGRFDQTMQPEADGSRLYRYSTRFDGNFDLVVTLNDKNLVYVERDGQPLTLVADANPAVFWIGRKLFDFGTGQPANGWGIWRAERYYCLRIGSAWFVEVLD